jgi:hypothetical protein
MMSLFPTIIALIIIYLFSWFFQYLKSLEDNGCECALDNRRIVLMACIVLIILGRIIAIFTKLPEFAEIALGVVSLTFLVVTIWYASYLRKIKCECSESSARTVMEYYSWTLLLLIPIMIVLIAPLISMYIVYSVAKTVQPTTTQRVRARR